MPNPLDRAPVLCRAFLARNPGVQPVRIGAGAVADGVPLRNLLVSPRHALFLDGLLIPAETLVNGASVTRCEGLDSVEYFHIELDSHDVLLAEGCPAESFCDIGTRNVFQNAAEFLALRPDVPGTTLPFTVLTEDGEAFDAVRRRLDSRAGLASPDPAGQAGTMSGNIDLATHDAVAGWARTDAGAPLRLEVVDNGRVVGRVVANLMRRDVRDAGLGDGRCSFALQGLALDAQITHCIEVRQASDGAVLKEQVLAASAGVPSLVALQAMLAGFGRATHEPAELERLARLLESEAGRLRQARAA